MVQGSGIRGRHWDLLGVADELHVYGCFKLLVTNLFVLVAQLEPLPQRKPQVL